MSTPISPVADIVADMKAGRMVILVDEEDRENEGDLVIASEYATPEAINFMARYGRGLICLTLTKAHCQRLQLSPMARSNGTQFGTAFTVSIEAATGVTTGISAADRARTVAAAIAPHATASDLVQPGHVFPIQAVDGGVLIRAGHTEAGCDLAAMAGCVPSSVICEIMKDDGSMARLPDLQVFAAEHGLKIGTIADLIEYRSRSESLVQRAGERSLQTPWGSFTARLYRDAPSGNVHLALIKGDMTPTHPTAQAQTPVLVRVHEPLSLFDVLDSGRDVHSWSLGQALTTIESAGRGVAVLLNCGDNAEQLFAQFNPAESLAPKTAPPKFDLRTYGVGAQILKDCGVQRMQLMSQARRMPSMMGYGLEVTGYLDPSNK